MRSESLKELNKSNRAFMDTNVLIAAFIKDTGICFEILQRARDAEFMGFASIFVIEEFRRKLFTKFGINKNTIEEFVSLFEEALKIVVPDKMGIRVNGVCKRDPSDDNILAGALASDAEFLVTGDLHLLELNDFKGIVIIRPREFVNLLNGRAIQQTYIRRNDLKVKI